MTLFLSHPWLTKISLMLVGLFALLMILFVRHPVASELCINEVYATRGSESDWIELYNAGLNTRSLKGLYLTDDSRELTKFQIKEDLLILPKSFLVIYGEGHNDESGALTVSFGVGNGETIYLIAKDGRTVLDSLIVVKEDDTEVSVGRFPDGQKELFIMSQPTPGAQNQKDAILQTNPNKTL